MTRETLASLCAALGVHAMALFGVHVGTPARPLPVDAASLEVDLVPAAPAPAVAEVEPPKPEMLAAPMPPPPEPEPAPPEKPSATPAPKFRPPVRPKPAPPAAATGQPSAVRRDNTTSAGGAATTARPRYRSNPKPLYPPEARRLRQQGQVLLTVEVSAQGRALSVALRQTSGFPLIDQAAIQTVRQWNFEPARIGGVPVASRVEVPVRFRLAE